ncbi:MAG: ATP-binding cassette domain-containing protein [Pseudomonadota bacterium]|nr:ATP-binding cassette domain-containing protein [Pseudomonadota bacterium]
MIRFEHVSKRYDNGHDALKQVSFELGLGEMVFLTGHSGAGKSTILKLIALLEETSQGTIYLRGQNISHLSRNAKPKLRREMGIILQSPQLFLEQTAFDNVGLPLQISNTPYQEAQRRIRAALDKVGLLSKEKVLCSNLSMGEKQRINIARAVVSRPSLLLADEPTGNLDPKLSAEIMQLFAEFHSVGTSVLFATHDLSLIARQKHRILRVNQGRLLAGESA